MWQSVNLFLKTAVEHVGCVFAYFCGRHKNNLRLSFPSSFKNWLIYRSIILPWGYVALQTDWRKDAILIVLSTEAATKGVL